MERTAYNILDWVGDLGGLFEGLLIFFSAIYAFLHYQTFNNFLVQKLYRTEEGASLQQVDSNNDDWSEEKDNPMLTEGEWSCIIKRIVRFKCCICSWLRPKTKKYRLLRKGRQDLAVETDIVNFLKQLRAIWTILNMKLHLSKKEIEKIKETQRHNLELYSDTEVSQVGESDFIRKITLRNYEPSKFQTGDVTERGRSPTVDQSRDLKSIQRGLVSSFARSPTVDSSRDPKSIQRSLVSSFARSPTVDPSRDTKSIQRSLDSSFADEKSAVGFYS